MFHAGKIAIAVISTFALTASAQTKLTLSHNGAIQSAKQNTSVFFANLVKEKSGGKIEIQVAPAAQLGDDIPTLTALRTGTIDISVNSQGSISSIVPEYSAFGMPFMFKDLNHAWRVLDGPIGEQLAKLSEEKGLLVLGYLDNGIRHVSNKTKPINTPADMKGLKIRTPPDPATIDTMQALGADPQQIKFSELYVALQQGVVDGQENPLMNIWSSKLYEVQKYISYTAHKYEMTPFVMSKISYNKLPEGDRKILREAAAEAVKFDRKQWLESDQKMEKELKDKGVIFNQPPDLKPFAKASEVVIAKWLAGPHGEFVKKVVDAAKAAQ